MRSLWAFVIIIVIILSVDLYAFRGLNYLVTLSDNSALVKWFPWIFWAGTVLIFSGLVWTGSIFQNLRNPRLYIAITIFMGIFLMIYFPKLIFDTFQILSDLTVLLAKPFTDPQRLHRTRSIILMTGVISGSLIFFAFGSGMLVGNTNVKIFREQLSLKGLPESFNNFSIVQLSDFHLAGFYNNRDHISEVVKTVNDLEPDLILFTGDMVSNFAEEIDPFTEILRSLKAPYGKYAILGNHDYGQYFNWSSEKEKANNLSMVKQKIRETGFDLLLNENRQIIVNGDSIALIGVENWGKPPFPRYGDLEKAKAGLNGTEVSILMSHDPSHWDLWIRDHENIDLTLSGHTHGMQMGFEFGKFRWSPSRWQYKQWAGLYRSNGKYLYVNRGLGYTGFPGRVGIRPEITLFTLINQED